MPPDEAPSLVSTVPPILSPDAGQPENDIAQALDTGGQSDEASFDKAKDDEARAESAAIRLYGRYGWSLPRKTRDTPLAEPPPVIQPCRPALLPGEQFAVALKDLSDALLTLAFALKDERAPPSSVEDERPALFEVTRSHIRITTGNEPYSFWVSFPGDHDVADGERLAFECPYAPFAILARSWNPELQEYCAFRYDADAALVHVRIPGLSPYAFTGSVRATPAAAPWSHPADLTAAERAAPLDPRSVRKALAVVPPFIPARKGARELMFANVGLRGERLTVGRMGAWCAVELMTTSPFDVALSREVSVALSKALRRMDGANTELSEYGDLRVVGDGLFGFAWRLEGGPMPFSPPGLEQTPSVSLQLSHDQLKYALFWADFWWSKSYQTAMRLIFYPTCLNARIDETKLRGIVEPRGSNSWAFTWQHCKGDENDAQPTAEITVAVEHLLLAITGIGLEPFKIGIVANQHGEPVGLKLESQQDELTYRAYVQAVKPNATHR